MAMPKKADEVALRATLRTCITRREYAAVGKLARHSNKTVSALMRDLLLSALAASPPTKRAA